MSYPRLVPKRVLDWLFSKTSLDAVEGPTRVRVEGVVLGEDAVQSPLSSRRGAILEYRFWDRTHDSIVPDLEGSHTPLVAGRRGDALLVDVDGRVVLVPMKGDLELEFAGAWDPGMVPALLPDDLVRLHPELSAFTEELRFDEKVIHPGQRVRLEGHVEKARVAGGGAYRAGPKAAWDFIAKPDQEPFSIEEL